MTKGHVCWRALLAAFPYTTPILAGFAFLGFAYGVYMNVMGGDHLAGAAPGLSAIGAAVCNALLGVRGSRGWRRTAGHCGGGRCDAMTDMPLYQQAITVLLCTAATMLMRFLPFLVISARKPTPPLVRYLGNALPAAIFGLLVVYCLKDVAWGRPPHGMPELIAVAVTAGLHLWLRRMLVSMAAGTALYMLLVQRVFA